ncbi:MAG: M48 family metalloprotease [Chitinophagaceae bacterium]|nr:M48 family metalloprotease [Chitinophagaceae bacterium]
MFQFSQSPFLQALGYTIVNSLWQFATLWLIYLAVNSVFNISSHKKYAAAVSLQLVGFAWFLFTFIFYYNKCFYLAATGAAFNNELISFGQMSYTGSVKDRVLLGILRTEVFLPYLSVAYLIIFCFLIIKWVQAFRYTNFVQVTGLEKIDVQFRLFVERLRQQLGIKRFVGVFLSHHVKSPLTVGYLKPIILIPFACLNNLSLDQVEAVLLHELAHIKRSDYLINMLLSVIEVVLFFNPFMKLISRHIKRERENSCDDWVLQFEYNASNYAKALLTLATFNKNSVSAFTMKAVDQKQSLLIRVKRMIEKKDRTFNYRNQLITLLGLAVLISVMAWLTPGSKEQNVATATYKNQLFVPEPMAAKIVNPFFNPVFFLAEKTQTTPPAEKPLLRNNANKEISVFKISLPAYKTMQRHEEAINSEAVEATASAIDGEKIAAGIKVGNGDAISKSPLVAKVNDAVFENLNVQLSNLDLQVKQVEKYLKELPVDGLFKVSENTKAKQELSKALQTLRATISLVNKNTKKNKQARVRISQDSAETYFKKLYNQQDLPALNQQLDAQLEEVSVKTEVAAHYNNWKQQDKPGLVIFAPRVEPAHTYSYEYTDNPRLATGFKGVEQQEDKQEKMDAVMNAFADNVIEIHITRSIKTKGKQVKKIIKLIRI